MALNDVLLARIRGRLIATATLVMGCQGKSAPPPDPTPVVPAANAAADAAAPEDAVRDSVVAETADAGIAEPPGAGAADAVPADAVPADAAVDAATPARKSRPRRRRIPPQVLISI